MGRIAGTVAGAAGAAGGALGAGIAYGTAEAIIDRNREKTHFEFIPINEKEAREKIKIWIPLLKP